VRWNSLTSELKLCGSLKWRSSGECKEFQESSLSAYNATTYCPIPNCHIVSVSNGDSAFTATNPDWQITGDLTLRLRAEREMARRSPLRRPDFSISVARHCEQAA
jgi:hypothetical protein